MVGVGWDGVGWVVLWLGRGGWGGVGEGYVLGVG